MEYRAVSNQYVRGFTLLEMMIAIVVLVLLVTVVVPAFDSFISNQRVKTSAQGLFASLNYARSEAVRRNEDVFVRMFEDGDDWIWGVCLEGDVSAGDCLRVFRASRIRFAPEDPEDVEFTPEGRATSGATFTLCDVDGSEAVEDRIVHVGRSGMPSISLGGEPDGGCA